MSLFYLLCLFAMFLQKVSCRALRMKSMFWRSRLSFRTYCEITEDSYMANQFSIENELRNEIMGDQPASSMPLSSSVVDIDTSQPSKEVSSSFTGTRETRSITYGPKDLPEETLYIFDGTAMLFQAFYSRESRFNIDDTVIGKSLSNEIVTSMELQVQDYYQEL